MGESGHRISPTRLLIDLLHGEKKEIAVVLVYGFGVGVLSLAVPIGVQSLVNTVTFGSFSQPVLFLILTVFAGLSLAAFLRALQIVVVEQLQKRFFGQVALELSYRIPRLSLDNGSKSQFPSLVNRFFDVLTVQKSSATLLLEGFALALQIGLGIILLAFYHWFLLAFSLVLLLAIGSVLFLLGRGAVETSVDESVQKYRVAAWLEELALRPFLFRSTEARKMALSKADEIVSGYLKARSTHFSILMRQIVGSLALQAVASSALLGIGAFLVINNQLTLGQLVAAEIVVTTALGSLAKFQKHLEAYYDLIAALDKIDGLLSIPLETLGGEALPASTEPAKVEIRDLVYKYSHGPTLFDGLSFQAEPGTRVALLGGNASGKSTLVDLLYGIKAPQKGTVLIDGIDLRELSPELLRGQVALVRGLEILPGTIFENVQLGREKVSPEKIRDSLQRVGLMDEVLKFSEGVYTTLGADGSPLSIAQAHALVLARAIAGDPRLLLVDETLDELDEDSLSKALNLLLDPKAPWTLILSTHSESLSKRFRNVLSLSAHKERKRA